MVTHKLSTTNNVWISSDWHINHTSIAGPKVSKWKSGYRNFNSVPEMNEHLILQINKHVKCNDVIYFLGDFCFGGHRLTPEWRSRINCQNLHVCLGNHDEHLPEYIDCFSSVQDVLSIEDTNGHKIFMSHYKHAIWPGSHKGVIHLYGHSHATSEGWEIGKSMDMGIDNAYRLHKEYRPFSLNEVLKIMNKRPIHFGHVNTKSND